MLPYNVYNLCWKSATNSGNSNYLLGLNISFFVNTSWFRFVILLSVNILLNCWCQCNFKLEKDEINIRSEAVLRKRVQMTENPGT